ncbi:MAG: RHS repeat-associated core domain-containing protein, partial [Emcibacter sp.]|nr:RHS repeat-associated core domain-containing protein [Emcibacter sp.]
LASYAYDTSGRRMSIMLGNGTITSYSYHDDDALNTLSHNMTGTADDVDWTYGFNKVNQLISKAMGGGANLAFYKWGPQSTKNDAYTSNGLNQYSNVAGTSLSYDASGNLTGDGTWFYVYDVENMLLNASKPGVSASYLYDPLGRRSAKTVDTVLTTFLHDGVEEVADYNSSGTLLRRYVHGPGVDEYLVMYTGTGTANKSYFHANHQGSIVAMSDGSGTVTEQHSYDSYGNSDDLTGNPFRYTGRRLDAETGLYYYRARYYSPAIGRFLQTDPIGYGDGLNWYAYVGNDPVNLNDPMGLAKCGDLEGQECEDALDDADQARDDLEEVENLLKEIATQIKENGADSLTDAQQTIVDAVKDKFGNKFGSAKGLTKIANRLGNIAGRIGERNDPFSVRLMKGDNREGIAAYVVGNGRGGYKNAIYLNNAHLKDKRNDVRQMYIAHEGAHLSGASGDFYRKRGILQGISRGYNMYNNADSYACTLYPTVCGY